MMKAGEQCAKDWKTSETVSVKITQLSGNEFQSAKDCDQGIMSAVVEEVKAVKLTGQLAPGT